MSSIHRWSFAVVAALALAAPLSAQLNTPPDREQAPIVVSTPVTAPGLSFTPTLVDARAFVPVEEPTFAAPVPGTTESENVAMMIVGGAALVVGSVIGGDAGTIMMVGGGVIGLVGLYRYLR